MRNIFAEIIATTEQVTKEHYRNNKRSKLDKTSTTLLVSGCITIIVSGVLLYLIYAFFPNESSLTTAKGISLLFVLLVYCYRLYLLFLTNF